MQEQHRIIHDRWHRAINAQNLNDLMALYDDRATIDSAAVLVLERDPSGILKGKEKLRNHFRVFFDLIGPPSGKEWIRSPVVASGARTLLWEYPSAGGAGEQLDVVESFDIEHGFIVYHRVYWGRIGFGLLTDALNRLITPR
jgi:steroid Delta-isomerase